MKKVCSNGWKLIPQYIFNPETGEWKHHTNLVFKQRQWLQNISYDGGQFNLNLKQAPKDLAPSYQETLDLADEIFENAIKVR